jgi:hypothetical protein
MTATHPLLARVAAIASALLVALPGLALACPVCGGGNPANRFAYFASTIALSLLPLGLFVGAFLWLRARFADRGRNEFVERDAAAPKPRG